MESNNIIVREGEEEEYRRMAELPTYYSPQFEQQGALVRIYAQAPPNGNGVDLIPFSDRCPKGWDWASEDTDNSDIICRCEPHQVPVRLGDLAALKARWDAMVTEAATTIERLKASR